MAKDDLVAVKLPYVGATIVATDQSGFSRPAAINFVLDDTDPYSGISACILGLPFQVSPLRLDYGSKHMGWRWPQERGTVDIPKCQVRE